MFQETISPSDVQYMGKAGHSRACLLAIDTVVNSEAPPRKASLVAHIKGGHNREQQEHLFLFWDWNYVSLTVVHSGFASGYPGEGPRSFSQALCMIHDKGMPLNWILVEESVFNAIEYRRLTSELIDTLKRSDDDPHPLPDYAWNQEQHIRLLENREFWRLFHRSKLHSDWLDRELVDRCATLFTADQESAIRNAYILLEERLRELTDEYDAHSLELINRALNPLNGILTRSVLPASEREGIHLLFMGAFKAFRNPLAHRFVGVQDTQFNVELVYVVDLMLKLVDVLHQRKMKELNSGS